jgi:hypothetical protein
MSRRTVLLSLCLAAAVATNKGNADTSESGLKLRVLPSDSRQAKADQVEVLVFLENTDPTVSWTLIPRLIVGSGHLQRYPEPQLAVRVTAPSGRQLEVAASNEPAKRVPPSTCDFTSLAPGAFVGRRVPLTQPPLGFAFTERGKYVVKATLVSRASDWLKGAKRHDECWHDFDHVFDGTLEAELAIDVE